MEICAGYMNYHVWFTRLRKVDIYSKEYNNSKSCIKKLQPDFGTHAF